MAAFLCNCKLSVQPTEVVEAGPADGKAAADLDFGKNYVLVGRALELVVGVAAAAGD